MSEATAQLKIWLNAFHTAVGQDRDQARDQLLAHAYDRLRRLAARIGQDFRLPADISTSVIAQETYLRLRERLDRMTERDLVGFFRFAARQIRWMLLDWVRSHRGPQGRGQHEIGFADLGGGDQQRPPDAAEDTYDPARLAFWQAFHEQVDQLDEKERDVVTLLWYHGFTQPEAAELLDIPLPTLKFRWRCARLRLQQVLPTNLANWDRPELTD